MDNPIREKVPLGPYQPTLIIHGGAGSISRSNLPPELYKRYHDSLITYLENTRDLLDYGESALDAACYAVSKMEDDPLFNCGRGSVFTEAGTIEMEASVMVSSIRSSGPPQGQIKRGAAVGLVKNTRHPILLAKQVLIDADENKGLGGTGSMHCHLSGRDVEEWGWKERGLEKKGTEWFWTKRRWDEHRRGLQPRPDDLFDLIHSDSDHEDHPVRSQKSKDVMENALDLPSQGTVGAVCLDSWGNLAVATSTGGLTNKKSGRIGDTPTVGAGFWAESWDEELQDSQNIDTGNESFLSKFKDTVYDALAECFPPRSIDPPYTKLQSFPDPYSDQYCTHDVDFEPIHPSQPNIAVQRRRAVAMSGTGNGDSFLRTNAARTAASICRFSSSKKSLQKAVQAVAGPNGELQRSAGPRWSRTGEGEGGVIGIEIRTDSSTAKGLGSQKILGDVVFDFNCGGLWRAWYCRDNETGGEVPKVMVFRENYFS